MSSTCLLTADATHSAVGFQGVHDDFQTFGLFQDYRLSRRFTSSSAPPPTLHGGRKAASPADLVSVILSSST